MTFRVLRKAESPSSETRSDLSSVPPNNRDAGRGTGYTFGYGNWFIGINADDSATYAMQASAD